MTTTTDQWKITEGWLAAARRVPSPNCNPRPAGTVTELVVIHGISLPPGCYGGPEIEALFTNTLDPDAHPYFAEISALEVSAHFFIRRTGEVVQCVSTDARAWHAGVASWRGDSNINDRSIGIELVNPGHEYGYRPFPAAQMAALVSACSNSWPTSESPPS